MKRLCEEKLRKKRLNQVQKLTLIILKKKIIFCLEHAFKIFLKLCS